MNPIMYHISIDIKKKDSQSFDQDFDSIKMRILSTFRGTKQTLIIKISILLTNNS